MLYGPTMGVIGHWFKRRRGLAMGLTAVGSSAGGTIFPIAARKLIPIVGCVTHSIFILLCFFDPQLIIISASHGRSAFSGSYSSLSSLYPTSLSLDAFLPKTSKEAYSTLKRSRVPRLRFMHYRVSWLFWDCILVCSTRLLPCSAIS